MKLSLKSLCCLKATAVTRKKSTLCPGTARSRNMIFAAGHPAGECGKGITLTEDEAKNLFLALKNQFQSLS